MKNIIKIVLILLIILISNSVYRDTKLKIPSKYQIGKSDFYNYENSIYFRNYLNGYEFELLNGFDSNNAYLLQYINNNQILRKNYIFDGKKYYNRNNVIGFAGDMIRPINEDCYLIYGKKIQCIRIKGDLSLDVEFTGNISIIPDLDNRNKYILNNNTIFNINYRNVNNKLDIDESSFQILSSNYVKDKNKVISLPNWKVLEGVDAKSFEVFNETLTKRSSGVYLWYGIDNNNVYYYGDKLDYKRDNFNLDEYLVYKKNKELRDLNIKKLNQFFIPFIFISIIMVITYIILLNKKFIKVNIKHIFKILFIILVSYFIINRINDNRHNLNIFEILVPLFFGSFISIFTTKNQSNKKFNKFLFSVLMIVIALIIGYVTYELLRFIPPIRNILHYQFLDINTYW